MKASIIVRNYNGKDLLSNLLPGVIQVVENRGKGDEVIVVDDGSDDGSVEFVESNFPEVILVRISPNSGNSITPVNMGVQRASNPIVICLDSDVLVDMDFITPMLKHFKDKNVFAVCPKIVNPRFGHTVESVNYPFFKRGRLVGMLPGMTVGAILPDKPVEVWYSPGNCAGYDRARFLALGGLDILYRPFYYEDMDVCHRAWRRGWRTVYEPGAAIYHLKHVTTQRHLKKKANFQLYRTKNILLFTWKNLLDGRLLGMHLFWVLLYFMKALVTGDLVYPRAFFIAISQLKEVRSARKLEREEMAAEDREIFSRLQKLWL
ncbi:MAG: glycosyltransferase family 2 protein [bacterium]